MTNDVKALNERKYAITSSSGSDHRLYWHGNCWASGAPESLMTAEIAELELQRLKTARPHDQTLQRVDSVEEDAMAKRWSEKFQALLKESGYGDIPPQDRLTDEAKALRLRAVLAADQALRDAGYADFRGWREWNARPSPAGESDVEQWNVSVWDGYSTNSFPRRGTYEQIANTCAAYPPGYIWTISRASESTPPEAPFAPDVSGSVSAPQDETEAAPSFDVPRSI